MKNYQRKKKVESGSSETAKRLEIPEACNTIKKGLRQLKGKSQKKNTRNRGWARLSQVPNDPARKEENLERLLIAQVGGTSGNQNEEVKKGSSSKRLSNRQNGILSI